MLSLLPDRKNGFVFMINGEAEDARTVLGEVLTKHFTAPERHSRRGVVCRCAGQARKRSHRTASSAPDTSAQQPAGIDALASWTGRYRDPWFGEITLCPRHGRIHFAAMKSPKLSGTVMQLGKRYLIHWDNRDVDMDAWLHHEAAAGGQPATLRMAKLDPKGDFSSDYEDLRFQRIGDCP